MSQRIKRGVVKAVFLSVAAAVFVLLPAAQPPFIEGAAAGESDREEKVGRRPAEGAPDEAGYKIFFVDQADHSRPVFQSQAGTLEYGSSLSIRFPERIVGADGHIWSSEQKSPVEETLCQAGVQKFYIEYTRGRAVLPGGDEPEDGGEEDEKLAAQKKLDGWIRTARQAECLITGGDPQDSGAAVPFVENQAQNDSRIRNLVSRIDDKEWHYFYLLGKNYVPQTLVLGTCLDGEYSSVAADRFTLAFRGEKERYTVVKIGVRKHFESTDCAHRWSETEKVENRCLETGRQTILCEKCGLEETVVLPALGHADENGDSLCDRCRKRAFSQKEGDKITVSFRTEEGERPLAFTCLDENYRGSGKMLYLSDLVWDSGDTGLFFTGREDEEEIRRYFRQRFANDLSVGPALLEFSPKGEGSPASCAELLSEEEYGRYREKGLISLCGQRYLLRLPGGGGPRWAVEPDGTAVELGTEWEEARGNRLPGQDKACGLRPLILLERPDTDDEAETHIWRKGDRQVRAIGGKSYVFRCIDEDYANAQSEHKKGALFLCESVIRSDVGSDPETLHALSFGADNNYKTSEVRKWLLQSASESSFQLEPVLVGVDAAYSGSTEEGSYGQMDRSRMRRHGIGFQLLEDPIFSLSVEEALRYRDELWKFQGSDTENPQTQISPYSGGYYLRTPLYEEDGAGNFRYSDGIYAVDLGRGIIHAVKTDSTGVGLRPAFVLAQGGD